MAENFKNFNVVMVNAGEEMIVVPSGANGNVNHKPVYQTTNINMGENERTIDSVVQVHSLYITQDWNGNRPNASTRYNESTFKHIDLYILDSNKSSYKIYVASDVEIVPGCPYYIEKNITLSPTQYLVIYAPTTSEVSANSNLKINVVASAIEFKSDDQ